ncbi:MAG TPA: zinc ribbon domain-containing protein [Thermoanaerobaculia bacterium]|nr:zinc ribbon domain-containing protein [Thermoanaerobaculia bacterium]
MQCPSCGATVDDGAAECRSCGIIFARWRPRSERAPTLTKTPIPVTRHRAPYLIPAVAAVVILGGAAALFMARKPVQERLAQIREPEVAPVPSTERAADLSFRIPGSPAGLASNGRELLAGNRSGPWGVVRLTRDGDSFDAKKIEIIEPKYSQKITLGSLTWNGSHYVGLAMSAWFEQGTDSTVFTVHDPKTLAVLSHHREPKDAQLGCLAWDGRSYWAASRRHTWDDPKPPLLYRLDAQFNVVSTAPAPGKGCQGMAWDGRHLWLADVFGDTITVLDAAATPPKLVHRAELGIGYLSGLTFFEDDLWLVDYGDNRLHRIRRSTKLAWGRGEDPDPNAPVVAASAVPAPAVATPEVEELRRGLRHENWATRMRARMELDRLGAPVDYARNQNNFPKRDPENTDVLDHSIEIRDRQLRGSWTIWFGHELFVKREQTSSVVTLPVFAKYEVTVKRPDGTKTEKEFEAMAGENVLSDVHLADVTIPGEYQVSIFIHVQYVTPAGTAKILNNSGGFLDVRP